MTKTAVSYNAALGNLSAAYLAMWTVLQSFDPEADRWSEPADFGSREQRIRQVREALKRGRPEATVPARVDKELDRDTRRFESILDKLTAGAPFTPSMRTFARRLGSQGSRLSDDSVSLASVARK
jgi:hypothetical protein